ncbi:4-hydroxybenzoate polyprenyl transferase [Kwoniella heveanensis BCC8398]|uniref:4-hydroxybenzoate polyprenyltransferase, mitochondrial n=1 Tax=Kwoniella heveanensis BCC8398 TaxID=1296120 RepID=A0A1B9GMX0_9TREE|nr:4-hydroxybenzoate polyprenyl transferase [Kwoniella heveanensis BCC8398]
MLPISSCLASSARTSSSSLPYYRLFNATSVSHRYASSSLSATRPTNSISAFCASRRLFTSTPRSRQILSDETAKVKISSTSSSSHPHPSVIPSEIIEPKAPVPTKTQSLLDKLPGWAKPARPYLDLMRVDKPIGTLLLFWPCAWSITIASTVNQLPITTPLWYLSLFATGAWIMRGAGCTINDMWDAKMDAKVERTRTRPIAAGDITHFQALTFLGAQLSAGLAVLTQLNWYSIVLGASSLSLVILYPFMKRITYYPQVIFGLTFNWGAFLGWSAVAGVTDWAITAPMYVGGVAWGIAYDLIYAHQDKKDDVLAGVKSMALRFPDNSRTVIATLSTTFVSLLALTGHLAGLGPLYYMISVGGAAAHLAWQAITVNFDDRLDCWKKFCSNGYLGGLIWLGTAANYVHQVLMI